MKRKLWIVSFLFLFLSTCGSPAETSTSSEVKLTDPPPPTNTSPPPEPTSTSSPILFLDEFDGGLDNTWSWLNEDPERWLITPEGWLAITANNPSVLASESQIEQVNLLVQPSPPGDLVITTRLVANPDENFQQAGIFLLLDGINYVSILNAFCEFCLPDSGGYGIFMEGFKNGEPTANGLFLPHSQEKNDFYLRLVFSSVLILASVIFVGYPKVVMVILWRR